MKNGKTIVWGILAFVTLQGACVREKNHGDDEKCKQYLSFYSLDREANNVLHQNVEAGELYAFNPDGTLAGQWGLNPVPDLYTPVLPSGQYEMAFVANVSDNMEYNRPSTRASGGGEVKVKPRDGSRYYQADDVHVGKLETYVIHPGNPDRVDSIHVKRQVGMITIRVNGVWLDPTNYKGEMIVSGVARGVDFFQNTLAVPVDIIEYGTIVNEKMQIDAKCFPSVTTLVVTTRFVEVNTGTVLLEVTKTLEEMLTPNKHIIIEYKIETGNLVEFDLIVKDWDNNSDNSSADGQ